MSVKKVQRATIFRTDGTVEQIVPKNGKKFEYEELRDAVGGYITSPPKMQ